MTIKEKETERNKQIEIARKMIEEKISIDLIVKITGLKKNEIDKL